MAEGVRAMIVLGCDVGKTTGLALLDCDGPRPRLLTLAAVEGAELCRTLQSLFALHTIAAVGIETPTQVFAHGRGSKNQGARIGIERALLVARDAAGVCRATAAICGPLATVYDGQAHQVRRAVLGPLPRDHIDRFVASRVPLLIDVWPKASNDHQRDAAVAALWAWNKARGVTMTKRQKKG
jgi:hypothetical protein